MLNGPAWMNGPHDIKCKQPIFTKLNKLSNYELCGQILSCLTLNEFLYLQNIRISCDMKEACEKDYVYAIILSGLPWKQCSYYLRRSAGLHNASMRFLYSLNTINKSNLRASVVTWYNLLRNNSLQLFQTKLAKELYFENDQFQIERLYKSCYLEFALLLSLFQHVNVIDDESFESFTQNGSNNYNDNTNSNNNNNNNNNSNSNDNNWNKLMYMKYITIL